MMGRTDSILVNLPDRQREKGQAERSIMEQEKEVKSVGSKEVESMDILEPEKKMSERKMSERKMSERKMSGTKMSGTKMSGSRDPSAYIVRTNTLPDAIIQQIRKNSRPTGLLKSSKLSKKLRAEMTGERHCDICEMLFKNKIEFSKCEHSANFCESCLQHYVINKVSMFEEVYCPQEGCGQLMDPSHPFFSTLPQKIQVNYFKIHQYYQSMKDVNVRMCTLEDCNGRLTKVQGGYLICDSCEKEFCENCFLRRHKGDCDVEEVKFFQNTLKFRQCFKCKFVIERNQGCNHMTCRCGNQFCYLCGTKWVPSHRCEGLAAFVPPVRPPHLTTDIDNPIFEIEGGECCDCCSCCDNLCVCAVGSCCYSCMRCVPVQNETLSSILILPCKVVSLLAFTIFYLALFVMKDLLLLSIITVLTLLSGMFGFSFEFMCDVYGDTDFVIVKILVVIFFVPVCVIAGLIIAIREIFIAVGLELVRTTCESYVLGFRLICRMK